MQSARVNAIYTAFATLVFTGLQYFQGERSVMVLAVGAVMFFVFTFFMLRLINRVTSVMVGGLSRKRGERTSDADAERGPEVIEPTTSRPEHVRRRRERRTRRGRRS
ncbi:MAG: hypothetical protein M0R73_04020 [Dehalococcoidia bacterium]|nr:hypothetical protein [Dehalococcoidia bacterium]